MIMKHYHPPPSGTAPPTPTVERPSGGIPSTIDPSPQPMQMDVEDKPPSNPSTSSMIPYGSFGGGASGYTAPVTTQKPRSVGASTRTAGYTP